ncbi:hypothetical protein AS850_11065 [Frondihabitans sp. 762G35]|uniref:hypothetical protein n=1 Tax=Frondihabitans sp. 762G35 TaxID=1446794 RepID=UPI000D21FA3F|nr:hypothetical protein [Frondihabitans sp. 762G35]ARC57611.1 hypothetical protein AS850_11065 [Frondihabitans sp. 762G35]
MRFIPTIPGRDGVGLRLFAPGDVLPGTDERSTDEVAVEWAGGRGGHPTSYALIGGREQPRGGVTEFGPLRATGRFEGALASVHVDDVRFGLPLEYRDAVRAGSERGGRALHVGVAAHGVMGSSALAFGWVTELLCFVVGCQEPAPDDEVLDTWRSISRITR